MWHNSPLYLFFPSGHFSTAADSPRSSGRHSLLSIGSGRGHCSDRLDPAVHRRWVRLHRHSDRAPGTAGGPLQFWPVRNGDSGPAVRSRHDGGDRRVRVRRSGVDRSSWQSETGRQKVKKRLKKKKWRFKVDSVREGCVWLLFISSVQGQTPSTDGKLKIFVVLCF